MGLHQAGRLSEAEARYRRALELAPELPDAHGYLGLVLHQRGASDAGVAALRRAVALAPDDLVLHANLAAVLAERREPEAALAAWREVVRIDPADAEGHFHVGLLLDELGRPGDAVAALEGALALAPGEASVHAALAGALRASGDAERALAAAERAAALDPASGPAARQRGAALAALGRAGDAEAAYRRALELEPEHASTWHNLGSLALAAGRAGDALGAFERAAALTGNAAPDAARAAALGAARALLALSRPGEALARCRTARAGAAPGAAPASAALPTLARILARLDAGADAARLAGELLDCLESPAVEAQPLAGACARALRTRIGARLGGDAGAVDAEALDAALEDDRLWLAYLARLVNTDPILEGVVARLRALHLARAGEPVGPARIAHAAALAAQAFANEYVVWVCEEERAGLDALVERLVGGPAAFEDADRLEHALLAAAAYRSPAALPGAALDAFLAPEAGSAPTRALLRSAVLEPRAERRIAEALPAIGPVSDPTSRAVREQYEDNPYPRWQALPPSAPTSIVEILGGRCPEHRPAPNLAGSPPVLVAGCGTGREAIDIAESCPGTEVLAVDLSRRSLAYGARIAAERGLERITFAHGDILGLDALARRFPVIVSTGVLHHMDDPLAGWRVLAGLLEPGGVMRVGLYSRRARADVAAAREAIAASGVEPTPEGIARFRAELLAAGPDHPLASLAASEDLYTTSACRDLLFHVCERTFDPAAIATALDALGLRFLGFEIPDQGTVRDFRTAHPEPGAHLDLGAWDRFEREHPAAFVGMYQFWCVRPC